MGEADDSVAFFSAAIQDRRWEWCPVYICIGNSQPRPDFPSQAINAGALYGCKLTYCAVDTGSKPASVEVTLMDVNFLCTSYRFKRGIRRRNTDHVMKPLLTIIEQTEKNLA